MPGPAEALAALLGVPCPDLGAGEGLPLFWHWVYLLERPTQSDLGRDGHPVAGIPAPPGPNQRRMWAGGRVRSLAPLRTGEEATRRTSVLASVEKAGRAGRLTFVTARHEVFQRDRLVVDEHQNIVYVEESRPSSKEANVATPASRPPEQPPSGSEWSIDVDPVLLFRFSALTYNGHRIHYDRDYATEVEGYPGLVTHGPLQAVAMSEAVRAMKGLPGNRAECQYRLLAPLFDDQGLIVSTHVDESGLTAAVRDRWGR